MKSKVNNKTQSFQNERKNALKLLEEWMGNLDDKHVAVEEKK